MDRDSEHILVTQRLSKTFSGFTAVDGVDLRVRRGEIHALIGPNGAGKTIFETAEYGPSAMPVRW